MATPSSPPAVLPEASSLSLHSLRVELQRRGLDTSGLKLALTHRLSVALQRSAGATAPISVPRRFPRRATLVSNARKRAADAVEAARAEKRARLDVVGTLVAGTVWITGQDEMDAVWDVSDGYGKGNLSRSEPVFGAANNAKAQAKSGRAARQLLTLEKAGVAEVVGADREDVEHLQMSAIEGFHASFEARRIRLVDIEGRRLDDSLAVWRRLCADDPYFARQYGAYVKYRRGGWMPRSGLKYGVDWVLYRAGGKRHAHSPYCVILDFESDRIQPSWVRLQNRLRLVKNVAKNLIAAKVTMDTGNALIPTSPQVAVDSVRITELTIDRWVS